MYFINFDFNFVVMFRSVAKGIKQIIISTAIIIATSINFCFKSGFSEQDWLVWTNKCLAQSYDPSGDARLKKWELTITGDNFIRLRKTYVKGKQVYYSFNLSKLSEMTYLGNTSSGTIQLKTLEDDIIVQTYKDRHGDVDSMTTVLNIPVKNMEPERLDSLKEALDYFKTKGL